MTLIDEIKRNRESNPIYGGRLADALLEIEGMLDDYTSEKTCELVTIARIGNAVHRRTTNERK
jgi:hypothetical protein